MEKETSLRALNSPRVDNDSASSGNPDDHDDSYDIETEAGETVEENKNEDNTGAIRYYLLSNRQSTVNINIFV